MSFLFTARLPKPDQRVKDVLHHPRESVVARIGIGRKASFCSQ